jgi:hypothetical protein
MSFLFLPRAERERRHFLRHSLRFFSTTRRQKNFPAKKMEKNEFSRLKRRLRSTQSICAVCKNQKVVGAEK